MAREMQLTRVILETDSTHVINMIHKRFTFILHLQPDLFDEVFSFIHFPGWTMQVSHIHHEANSYVDALAKLEDMILVSPL
jgi:ribonuclease HI